jgi:hypothetical protein
VIVSWDEIMAIRRVVKQLDADVNFHGELHHMSAFHAFFMNGKTQFV